MFKYNFVIFGTDDALYRTSYADVFDRKDVIYISSWREYLTPLQRILFRLHFTYRINKFVRLPFKQFWCSKFFTKQFDDDKPICFLFFSDWVRLDGLNLARFLKSKYKNCKCVWFLQDLLKKQIDSSLNPLNIEKIKPDYDLIMSFDISDCETYNLVYHPLVFSSLEKEAKSPIVSDIYFLGLAKDRLHMILEVYKHLKDAGLRCDFHIVGVPAKDRKYEDEIDYCGLMSYDINLKHILQTKCLLEIMQGGGTGYTQRCCEAVCLDKYLITNNRSILDAPFYNEQMIGFFESPIELSDDFINIIKKGKGANYNYKQHFSPIELLEFINERL